MQTGGRESEPGEPHAPLEINKLRERLLLRVREAAELCGLPLSTAYTLVAAGQWPVVRNGRSIRVITTGLLKWIEEQSEQ